MKQREVVLDYNKLIRWATRAGFDVDFTPGTSEYDDYYDTPMSLTVSHHDRHVRLSARNLEDLFERLKYSHERIFVELCCPPFEDEDE
jgi:hypothetical protein